MSDHQMPVFASLIVEEMKGIPRSNEPVTFGIPFPVGLIKETTSLLLEDDNNAKLPLQLQILAFWSDGSIKWLLIDSQISLDAYEKKTLRLSGNQYSSPPNQLTGIIISHGGNSYSVDTGNAAFFIDKKIFRPFGEVRINNQNVINPQGCLTILMDEKGDCLQPVIKNIKLENQGHLRATIKIEGQFQSKTEEALALFVARLHFYYKKEAVKVEFTIHNPKAAKHPGGLWDLGDPGSFLFKELAFSIGMENAGIMKAELVVDDDWCSPNETQKFHQTFTFPEDLLLYQDSSGGENWRSTNHVNRNNEVRTSFRGFRVNLGEKKIHEGFRASPIINVSNDTSNFTLVLEHFWQNFPKAFHLKDKKLSVKIFPGEFNDLYELQGGEQKTHVVYFDFSSHKVGALRWATNPLRVRPTPKWYVDSGAIPYLVERPQRYGDELWQLIDAVIDGDASFFARREIIDEYGWRNFGELYADHEAVNHKGNSPLVSHYNNQYDGIYGFLMQYMSTGEQRWYQLADELCRHVRDIDIYHTDQDRPEYNHGLFWHTEHYIDACTATHRCFSRRHDDKRNLKDYGGGPSLSHTYATGLLYHYYLTGDCSSREACQELVDFIATNIRFYSTISNRLYCAIKKNIHSLKNIGGPHKLVNLNKVYTLDGPGRASGNSLSVLIDGFVLTGKREYLELTESLVRECVGPKDNIAARDLLDIENRWMYTVFLQALGKYIWIKHEKKESDYCARHARDSFLAYSRWMLDHEMLYFDQPKKLEYPNETWSAQEIRKAHILAMAGFCLAQGQADSDDYLERGRYFYENALLQLQSFATASLTRPVILLLQNVLSSLFCMENSSCLVLEEFKGRRSSWFTARFFGKICLQDEVQFIVNKLFK